METIDKMFRDLPAELQKEVMAFIKNLTTKIKKTHHKKLRQDWAEALREYRTKYTSLDLQKKSLEWRGD